MPLPFRRLMALLPLLTSVAAHAMSLGEIVVDSRLGEPLRARVPINLDDEALPGSQCGRLIGPTRRHPDLAGARVELVGRSGQHHLAISTPGPIGDPMLDITLRVEGCGPVLQKDYVILLLPKEAEAAPITAPISPAVTAPAVAPARAPARRTAARRAAPARSGQAGAAHVRKPAGRFVFKLDYDDSAFGQMAERIARQRQAAYRAGELQAKVEPIPRDRLVLEPPPEDFQPGTPAAAVPGAPAGQAAGTEPGSTAAPSRPAGGAGLVPPPPPAPSRLAGLLHSYGLLWLLLLLILLAAAVAYWLKQRRPRSRFLDKTASEHLGPMIHTDVEGFRTRPLLQPADEVFVEPPEAKTLLDEALEVPPREAVEVVPLEIRVPTTVIETEGLSVEQHDSLHHVMELAEVMLAFGRSGQAIETLSQHIRDNPRLSVDPWLKLLDLYFQSSLRTEFEALAANLHKYYNIAIIDWADYAAGAGRQEGPLTLEALPHIMSRLTERWGTQAGLDYLDKLLADNRGGQRLGFSMPIVRDILLLRDILRQICAVSASSQ